jgi:hypothetical protein
MKTPIVTILIISILWACTSSNKKDQSKNIAQLNNKTDSEITKTDNDSVEIPNFEIEIKLNETAEKKINDDKESIIVQAYFSGIPKDTTLQDYIDEGEISIGSHKVELFETRVAMFENLKISGKDYEELKDKNFEVLINVFTGRRTSQFNLINCDLLQDKIDNIKGRRWILKGKLITEN